jgi:PAS domain S-box-containing protein
VRSDIDEGDRTSAQLREREAAYRAFAGIVPGNTWTASPRGELTFIGHDWQEVDADQAARALGTAWLDEVHDDDRERVRTRWAEAIRTGEPYDIEFRVRVSGAAFRWYRVRAMPVRDDAGTIVRWIGLNLDINDRYEADRARDMYASLVERSSNFIAISDPHGRLVEVNAAGRALIGIASVDDCRGLPLLAFVDAPERAAAEAEAFAELARDGRWRGDLALRHVGTGRRIPATCVAFMLTAVDGTVLGIAAVFHDQRDKARIEDGLRLLARTGAALVESLDAQRTIEQIAHAFLDGFAALCVIDVVSNNGSVRRTVAHRDAAAAVHLPSDPPYGMRSLISVPIITPAGDVAGALSCALDDRSDRDDYDAVDRGFVEEVARRAGAAIANVRQYERERRVALELQAASLPARLPSVAGIRLDVAYRPGSTEASIGGDWYDAFVVGDGRLVMTCGDVLGHGLHAAVSMTKLRLAMQSAAMVDADPHVMLRVADATLRVSDPDAYATAIAAVYDPATRRLSVASAGHPCPLLRSADRIAELPVAGLMIGLRGDAARDVADFAIPAGACIALYTDGLIEFTRDTDAGQERLIAAFRNADVQRSERPAEALVDAVLAADTARDDIAVLLATFT